MAIRGEHTKQRVINKSLHLFSVKGYYNTSINDILEATNLTKGGLYTHFKSKEDLWYATYAKAVSIWKDIVFEDVYKIENPIKRLKKALHNDLQDYLGADVFEGGCFFLNMLVELTGQSLTMSDFVQKGITGFTNVIERWLKEANGKKMLKPGLDLNETANFIVISINGCAALYSSIRDPKLCTITLTHLYADINELKK